MIYREKNADYQNKFYYDLILDDIVLSDFDGSAEQLQHLMNIDCALALSVCKSRNLPPCVFVLSLLYMKRLHSLPLSSSSTLTKIDNLTTKELYLIATLLANKYLIDEGEDEQIFNSELAEITGIKTERINHIERHVLTALNWNLYISNNEFEEFYLLFKNQMLNKSDKNVEQIEIDDPTEFYNLCLKFLPQFIEYLALTSFILLGSTLSILTAIHIGTITHSTLMKTFNPLTMNCSQFPICYLNDHHNGNKSLLKQKQFLYIENDFPKLNFDFENETTDKTQLTTNIFDRSSCSIDILQPCSLPRPLVPTFG